MAAPRVRTVVTAERRRRSAAASPGSLVLTTNIAPTRQVKSAARPMRQPSASRVQ
jgi:hypothetical protein